MDKSMLGDLDALPEADKQRMSAMIDQLQIRDRKKLKHLSKRFRIFADIMKRIPLGLFQPEKEKERKNGGWHEFHDK
ncbi:UNVERIFIED_CONTAM: Mitochondrial import inner membrane translocase subunit Tim9 [Sesamum angustifolium]|uniref:Mitochondrial import inner membrane translocase subunit Tim9 n=1 Tax=Sesamum angustifolium TaxID=2727405 RepID=A0AAW2QAC2_9LAMI